ncbi:hypothetical protein BPOR_0557g00060 [Botrytis porri]|uniref:Epoxide hydrolase N-terminal domain-containing protein n=1 Tax=Botrytis porri TaxID=87229 RepID=A0A4Z1KKE8_9HELO|nr:hypothetical protein BPOR_0557g00060 [Botrytis porri]
MPFHYYLFTDGRVPILRSSRFSPTCRTPSPHPSFHIIAPSLPNFGFSSGVKKRGFPMAQYAETLNKFMTKLGVLQSTKPQTLAYGLVNLLVALLGWIYEKLHDWSDEYPWTNDEILTWDQELLRESTMKPPMHTPEDKECTVGKLQQWTADVKLGLAYNPKDLENVPKLWGRTLGNVVYEVENDSGG